MTFDELVPNPSQGWQEFQLRISKDKVISVPALNEVSSQNGWTYVYVVNNRVLYIGNTGSELLIKRVGPELNKNTDNILRVNVESKLAYTNIRISKQLKNSIEQDHPIVLRAYPEFWYHPNYNNGQMTIEDIAIDFDLNFLLRWSPISIQGSLINPQPISIERALILKHIKLAEQEDSYSFLPPWNLGLG